MKEDLFYTQWNRNELDYSEFKVVRIDIPNNLSVERNLDFKEYLPWNEKSRNSSHLDILLRNDNFANVESKLISFNLTYKILIENVQKLFLDSKMSSTLFRYKINTEGHRMSWDAYHPYEDIDDYLDFLAKNYSNLVTLENIGKSYEGRIMRVLKVCKIQCGHKPAIWIDGGIHAREWISPATVTYLIKKLLEEMTENPDLIEKLDWYFLPVLNPDGKKI